MCMLKTACGMTHGKDITNNTLTKWVHTMPNCVPICEALENLSAVHTMSSEQPKYLGPASEAWGNADLNILVDCLRAHPPFTTLESELLVSLATGHIGGKTVNCDDAHEIGEKAMVQMIGS